MNIEQYITELKERKWTSPEDVDEYFLNTLNKVAEEARREALQYAINLSDKIETEAWHTELNEWKAFKHFRNKLREVLSNQ